MKKKHILVLLELQTYILLMYGLFNLVIDILLNDTLISKFIKKIMTISLFYLFQHEPLYVDLLFFFQLSLCYYGVLSLTALSFLSRYLKSCYFVTYICFVSQKIFAFIILNNGYIFYMSIKKLRIMYSSFINYNR